MPLRASLASASIPLGAELGDLRLTVVADHLTVVAFADPRKPAVLHVVVDAVRAIAALEPRSVSVSVEVVGGDTRSRNPGGLSIPVGAERNRKWWVVVARAVTTRLRTMDFNGITV